MGIIHTWLDTFFDVSPGLFFMIAVDSGRRENIDLDVNVFEIQIQYIPMCYIWLTQIRKLIRICFAESV